MSCGSHIFHMWGTHRLLAGLHQPLHEPPIAGLCIDGRRENGSRVRIVCLLLETKFDERTTRVVGEIGVS
jgi:hypothetical protein